MTDDGELLRRYLRDDSQEAFAELVERHINVVYGAALRQARDRGLAEDIVQKVFTELAARAAALRERPEVLSWLYAARNADCSRGTSFPLATIRRPCSASAGLRMGEFFADSWGGGD